MITFSSDIGQQLVDRKECGVIAERYFNTQEDPEQILITGENSEWFHKNFPESLNIIKDDHKIIGFTFILLSDDDIMYKFLHKDINEQAILDEFKKNYTIKRMSNVYLCASVILEDYRGKGLATEGFRKQIIKLKDVNALYSWPISLEGKRLSEKISKITSIKLYMRDK